MNRYSKIIIFICAIGTLCYNLVAQSRTIDSLQFALKNAKHDTVKIAIRLKLGDLKHIERIGHWDSILKDCKILLENRRPSDPSFLIFKKYFARSINSLGFACYRHGDYKKALDLFKKCLVIETEIGAKPEIASANNNIGEIYLSLGNVTKALEYIQKGSKLKEALDNKEDIADSYSCLANVYKAQGDILKALEYYERARKMHESINNKNGVADALNDVGVIYRSQGENSKALEFFFKSLQVQQEIGDKHDISNSLNNIGTVFYEQKEIAKALDYFNRGLKIQEEMDDKAGYSNTLNNLGAIYITAGDPSISTNEKESKKAGVKKGLSYFEKSMEIKRAIGDKKGQAYTLNNIAVIYYNQKNYKVAFDYCFKSMKISKELGFPDIIRNSALKLFQLYKIKGDHKAALQNYELYVQMRDSINNVSTRKASIKSQLKYEYEKQAAADSVAHAKESEIKNVELKRQSAEIRVKKNQQYALFGGLFLVCVFGVFMYNRFKVTQKQKTVIEDQKEIVEMQKKLVEEKQLEILDSIKYARRIQMAQIPSEKRVFGILNRMKK